MKMINDTKRVLYYTNFFLNIIVRLNHIPGLASDTYHIILYLYRNLHENSSPSS